MLTFIQTHAQIETHTKNTCLGILWPEFSPSPFHLYQSFLKSGKHLVFRGEGVDSCWLLSFLTSH